MSEHTVATVRELEESGRIVTQIKGREIGIFKIDGEIRAYNNWCAHQSGPICEGPLSGTNEATFDREVLKTETEWVREGKIIRCPWHDWEYDLGTGECLSKEGIRLPEYPVSVEDGQIVVSL